MLSMATEVGGPQNNNGHPWPEADQTAVSLLQPTASLTYRGDHLRLSAWDETTVVVEIQSFAALFGAHLVTAT
jgi:hypothetical protein